MSPPGVTDGAAEWSPQARPPCFCEKDTRTPSPAGLGPGRYTLGRWDIVVDSDMVPRSPDRSHFVGSGVTMKQSADNLRAALDLPAEVVRQLTSDNPARLIGL